MYKQAIAKLQEVMSKKYPEFRAKFYINRKNRLIHILEWTNVYLILTIIEFFCGTANGFLRNI